MGSARQGETTVTAALRQGETAASEQPEPAVSPVTDMWADGDAVLSSIDAKAASENFAVASRLLPARYRADLMAVYGFARLVDDLGDEGDHDVAVRLAALDAVDADLRTIAAGGAPRLAALRRLAPTVSAHSLPTAPFHRLVQANRIDQREADYRSFEQLLDYCRYSADPVGQIVLGVFGYHDEHRIELSDWVCTALQLAEHFGDVVQDAERGRIYLPRVDRERFGVRDADLLASPSPERLRALLAYEVSRAQTLLSRGAPLVASLRGPARIAVAGFVAGGQAALDALGRAGFDISGGPPPRSKARIAARTLALAVSG